MLNSENGTLGLGPERMGCFPVEQHRQEVVGSMACSYLSLISLQQGCRDPRRGMWEHYPPYPFLDQCGGHSGICRSPVSKLSKWHLAEAALGLDACGILCGFPFWKKVSMQFLSSFIYRAQGPTGPRVSPIAKIVKTHFGALGVSPLLFSHVRGLFRFSVSPQLGKLPQSLSLLLVFPVSSLVNLSILS